jgi:adenylosuccinate lyase
LAVDAILRLYQNVAAGLVVYPRVIARGLEEELPFMATENILMAAVAAGGDRQDLHERIRRHSQAAAAVVKEQGGRNDLIERLGSDPAFRAVDMRAALDPARFVGRAPQQVDEFIADHVEPIRKRLATALAGDAEIRV